MEPAPPRMVLEDLPPEVNNISYSVIGAAIEVHRTLGPGMLESAYQECLAHELALRGHRVRREVPVPLAYKELRLSNAFRIDLLVDELVVVEVKTVETILEVHEAQVRSYVRLANKPLGLLVNFKERFVRDGIKRFPNASPAFAPSPLRADSAAVQHD